MALFKDGVAVPLAYGADWSERHMYGDELVSLVESDFGLIRLEFVLRYADFPGQGHAVLTREEYESHLRVGIRSWLIYQRYERDPDGGEARGRTYGYAAVAYAQKIGYRKGDPIVATADRPAGEFNLDIAEAFFRGFAAVVREAGYLAGGYGFWDVIYRLQDRGVVDVLWLCGAQSRWREGIHLYQFNNGRIFPGSPPVSSDLCMQFELVGTPAISPPPALRTLEEPMLVPAAPDGGTFWTIPVPYNRSSAIQITPAGSPVYVEHIYNWGVDGGKLGDPNPNYGEPGVDAIGVDLQKVKVIPVPLGTGKADLVYSSAAPFYVTVVDQ